MGVKYISEGYFEEDGRFTVKKNFGNIKTEKLEALAQELAGYLLKIELTETSTYDNSDDDRVDGYSRHVYHSTVYAELDPLEDNEALLFVRGELKGVVFRVTRSSRYDKESLHAFFFDGSVAQSATLGHSASHSSDYTTVERMTLVVRGKDGAPETGKSIRFEQHEMYPSF